MQIDIIILSLAESVPVQGGKMSSRLSQLSHLICYNFKGYRK